MQLNADLLSKFVQNFFARGQVRARAREATRQLFPVVREETEYVLRESLASSRIAFKTYRTYKTEMWSECGASSLGAQ